MNLRLLRPAALLPLLLVLLSLPLAAQSGPPLSALPVTQEERDAIIDGLDWRTEAARYDLPRSGSTVALREGWALTLGTDARKANMVWEGVDDENLEALLVNLDSKATAYFQYKDVGYVTLDDWADIDPDGLLESIRESTAADNAEREKVGYTPLTVVDWLQPPQLDREASTVSWALELEDDGQRIVNVTVIRLGRNGYEQIIWVNSLGLYQENPTTVADLADSHRFGLGARHTDYEAGDVTSGFGIASLVAVATGATTYKSRGFIAAAGAFALAFAKKAWIYVLAAMGGLGAAWWRKASGRKRAQATRAGGAEAPSSQDEPNA